MSRKPDDEKWMRRALELAEGGMGHVSPNPMVGAVIVKDGQVIGEGFHEKYGQLHAERNAIADCRRRGNDPEGADIYVTLEPCCHHGKTPPCTEAVIENRIARVVWGSLDANPLVAGQGLKILEEAGIEVEGPVLEKECLDLNRIFFHYISTGKPYVIMKYAMTADGRIASVTGDSRWITGPEARNHTHLTRKRVSAILVGSGTVLADDPMLNCRYQAPDGKEITSAASREGDSVDPVRVICDSRLRIPADSAVVRTADRIRTIAAYVENGSEEMESAKSLLLKAGVELMPVPADAEGHADLDRVLTRLGEMKIDSVLVEGGGEIHYSLSKTDWPSEVQVYIAPKIIGGREARGPVGGSGIPVMENCVKLGTPEIETFGDDILITYRKE